MRSGREKIEKLISATRIAVVGASSDPNKLTGRPIAYMLGRGFKGEIIPINSKREKIQGLNAYPSLSAVNKPVELALIGTAANEVEATIAEGIASGIQAFVVLSSGFSEHNSDGATMQARLTALANRHDVAIVGPNCLGVINAETGLIASFTTAMEANTLRAGGFGFASQSGALGAYWLDLVLQAGLGVSRWVTTGNECDVDLGAAIGMLAEDPMTKVIGVYSEGVKDGTGFREALRIASCKGKPVFIIKAGQSPAGAMAAASHTGALAGEDAVYQACFDQYGAIRVLSLSEMIDAAKIVLHDSVPPAGEFGVLSVSGGAGVMLADAISETSLSLPQLSNDTAHDLARVLPGFSKPQNPIDLTANVLTDIGLFSKTLEIVEAAPELDACILFIGLMHSISEDITEAILLARLRRNRPFIVVWIGARSDAIKKLNAAKIPVYTDIVQAVRALERVSKANMRRLTIVNNAACPQQMDFPLVQVKPLSEWQGKNKLRRIGGVNVPRGFMVNDARDVDDAITGFKGPFVAKIQSTEMIHKSDHGGVILDLADIEAVKNAVQQLKDLGETRSIQYDGILIEEMVDFDIELIAGFRRDPVFGSMLMVGRGGLEAELDPDVSLALSPLSYEKIDLMLRSLRCAQLFNGFRGNAPIAVEIIAQALAHINEAFVDDPCFDEIEINPLVVRQGKVTALDVLMKVGEAQS